MVRLSNTDMPRLSRRMDFMLGSERMLKAHHKNGVYFKYLELKKNAYDANCNKSLCKIQQEMYDIYFNEYLPLKDQAKNTTLLPKLQDSKPPRYKKIATVKGKEQFLKLPNIETSDIFAHEKNKHKSSECFIEALRETEAIHKKETPPDIDYVAGDEYRSARPFSRCSLWPDDISNYSMPPEIDEHRLKILKAAIALTSQPAPVQDCSIKPRRLRRSYVLNLRRTSKLLWENDLLMRAGPPPKRKKQDSMISELDCSSRKSLGDFNSAIVKTKPSIFRNRILNDEDDDDSDIVFQFTDRQSRGSFASILNGVIGKTPLVSFCSDAPVHDIEADLYNSESSPDIFSVISERTGSSYTDYSYTSGSGSYYSTETDDQDQ